MGRRSPLGSERERELVRRYLAGEPTMDLCVAFDRSDTGIRDVLRKHGVRPSKSLPITSVELYDAFRLYSGGMNVRQVEYEVGRRGGSLGRALKKAGFRLRPHKKRKILALDQEADMASQYKNGATYQVLMKKFEVSDSVVKRVLKEHGIQPRTGWGRYKTEPWTDRKGVKHVFKSSWELAYAKHLDGQGADWKYEPMKVFLKECRCYTPDFGIYEGGQLVMLIEVKGWLDEKTIHRLEEFRAMYPALTLALVGPEDLAEMGLVEEKYLGHHMAEKVSEFNRQFEEVVS